MLSVCYDVNTIQLVYTFLFLFKRPLVKLTLILIFEMKVILATKTKKQLGTEKYTDKQKHSNIGNIKYLPIK